MRGIILNYAKKMTRDDLVRFVNKNGFNATDEEISVAVPMKNPLPETLPPTYIETAEFDCLHDEAIAYVKHIQGIAKRIEVNETKGTVHGYDTVLKHPITLENIEKRINFMEKCLDN